MRILVTGADGFIGSHVCESLVKSGYDVTAFVFYNSFNSWGWLDNIDIKIKKNLRIINGDIRDHDLIYNSTKKIDCIIHLAALISIPYSYNTPESFIQTNILGTYNILNSSFKNNVSKIIHTSTSEVYGTVKKLPISESGSLNAQSPYAASKISADQIALSYYKSYDLPVTILRPFNTFGPRQSARAIIPNIITQINSRKKIQLGNIKPKREFNYIDDTVDAFKLSLFNKKIIGEVINIGNGYNISILDLFNKISKIMNKKSKIQINKERIRKVESEVMNLKANNQKAKKLLNWRPKYSGKKGLESGLKKTIQWFSKSENLKFYKHDIYNI